jgi:CRP-like cAMP-binding protein
MAAEDLARLTPQLEHLPLPVNFVLHDRGAPIEYAYFCNSGVGSLVTEFSDGNSVEVGVGGRDGFWGGPLLAGVLSVPDRAFMQIGGEGYRIARDAFVKQVRSSRALDDLLQRSLYLEQRQSRQVAACNARHDVVERLARWLLMCHDRVTGDELELTHEFLALMLGTRRSSVTIAAGSLQQSGLIRYTRRVIHVTNRAELEHATCQCYSTIAQEYERVIGFPPRRVSAATV